MLNPEVQSEHHMQTQFDSPSPHGTSYLRNRDMGGSLSMEWLWPLLGDSIALSTFLTWKHQGSRRKKKPRTGPRKSYLRVRTVNGMSRAHGRTQRPEVSKRFPYGGLACDGCTCGICDSRLRPFWWLLPGSILRRHQISGFKWHQRLQWPGPPKLLQ